MKNLKAALQKYASRLPTGEAEILVARVIRKDRAFLYAHPDYRLSLIAYFRFRYYLHLRCSGIPIAYITHHKQFFGIDFFVNKHTLIPRPETELMVENAIEAIRRKWETEERIVFIDVGTGSGCIPIAIAKAMSNQQCSNVTIEHGPESKLSFYGIDISRPALKIAKQNARTQNVFINFLHGDLLEPFTKIFNFQFSIFNFVITANLPYLTEEQFDTEPSIQHEPHSALVAENGGLALYEKLLAQIQFLISHQHNISVSLFLEIDPSQSVAIPSLIYSHLPDARLTIKKDLAGHDRLVIIHYNPL